MDLQEENKRLKDELNKLKRVKNRFFWSLFIQKINKNDIMIVKSTLKTLIPA